MFFTKKEQNSVGVLPNQEWYFIGADMVFSSQEGLILISKPFIKIFRLANIQDSFI